MANGSGSTQCNNCWHFKYKEVGRNCMKYDFVFPKTTYEIMCRNHRRRFLKRLVTEWRQFVLFLILGIPAIFIYVFTGGWIDDFRKIRSRKRELLPLTLYFYSYCSEKPMQPLASFDDLQLPSFLMDVRLTVDTGNVLTIHLEPKISANIPELTKDVMIEIEGQKIRFSWLGGSNLLTCLDPQAMQRLHDWPSAVLFAQPASGTYKVVPSPF